VVLRVSDVLEGLRRFVSRRSLTALLDDTLADEALVIRGGLMELPGLRTSVQTAFVKDGYYSLSFFGENRMSMEEIIQTAKSAYPGALPNRQIRLTTAGRFADQIGRKLHREGLVPHLEVRFETNPTDEELLEIEGIFGLPVDNPMPGG